ncbi:MAG: helix-turn-helix transcriptional regulator, partial [Desulfocapsa sp.]|nr:helix-turn-helix transcriptional regulator [Desulfocapsa sp.]
GTATEITNHRQLEQDLRETNNRLMALINASPDIIYFKDGAGKWLLANDAGLQMFQLTATDYKGKTDAELATRNAFYHDAFLACMESDKASWNNGKISKGEEIIPTPEGEDRFFDLAKVPLFHADGTRQGLVILGHDITSHLKTENNLREEILARRKAAEVIQKKSKELEEANIALRVLLKQQKDIADEVQQSVLAQLEKAVLPYLNLIRQKQLDDKGKEYLDIIHDHISDVGTSFIKKLSNPDLRLTKKEILIADLVKSGKSTKDIARLLTLKTPSVESYRNKIRKKLGINNKKVSLYQYLSVTFSSKA